MMDSFYKWSRSASSGILFRAARRDAERELYEHMEDRYCDYLKKGFDPAAAEEKTLIAMGDADEVAALMRRAHDPLTGGIAMLKKSLTQRRWTTVYEGKDKKKFDAAVQRLAAADIEYRGSQYLAANRAGSQTLVSNVLNSKSRGPYIDWGNLSVQLVRTESLDRFCVQVRQRDIQKARQAL